MRPFALFFRLNSRIDGQTYIFVMLLGLPDDIHEEKPSFLQFKKKRITDGPTDQRTDGPTDGPTDGGTDPLIEMRGRI